MHYASNIPGWICFNTVKPFSKMTVDELEEHYTFLREKRPELVKEWSEKDTWTSYGLANSIDRLDGDMAYIEELLRDMETMLWNARV